MPVNLIVGDDASNAIVGTSGQDLIYGFNPQGPQSQVSTISATRVAAGLSQPVFVTAAPGDLDRLFIVERTGQIKILDLTTNQVLTTPFLDVSQQITTFSEGGLLGLTFDPGFAQNGYFYIDFTDVNDDTEIRRYQVSSADPNIADPTSGSAIITIDQPAGLGNHKAGWIGFGPDGYLYAALGDGGGGGDPQHSGQDMGSLLGKMLRVDVHADDFPADPTRNYSIPATNPFVGVAGVAPEIWALGLRNPWRDSFDRASGDFFIADVGQSSFEEIDIGQAGANYGWNVYEGQQPYAGGTPSGGTLTFPIYVYDHTVGHSITGGYVYRGTSDGLQGQYFFADYVDDKLFTLANDGSGWVATDRTSQVVADIGSLTNPAAFGEDGRGDLYIVDLDGEIFRLTPVVNSADIGDSLSGLAGDDVLFGGAGGDRLDGGPGADVLNGGSGFDYAVYASASTGVTADLAHPGVNTGDAAGDTYIEIEALTGSRWNDTLYGDSNTNILDGGAGRDALIGRAGDDQFFVDDPGDQVIEAAGEGWDIVRTSVSYTLAAGQSIEALTVDDYAATTPINLTGNEIRNYVIGNAGDNLLNGGGGPDRMVGLAGNDQFFVDDLGDEVIEAPNEGWDIVRSSISYTLAPGQSIEAITADDYAAATPINLTGNEIRNYVIGNAGDNMLNGGGGPDRMVGLAGGDQYFVDNIADEVVEAPNEGWDIVRSSISYALPAGQSIEAITADDYNATTNINLTGNELRNYVIGNNGDNIIDGGDGPDYLKGLDGADTFFFNSPIDGTMNIDTIADYTVGVDHIQLANAYFVQLAAGMLPSGAFAHGTSATEADDRIIYDDATGRLFFDPDGAGGAGAKQFATVGAKLALSSADFRVV